jgi:hypothetical protein
MLCFRPSVLPRKSHNPFYRRVFQVNIKFSSMAQIYPGAFARLDLLWPPPDGALLFFSLTVI